jgi:hypothetical protein
MRPPEQGEVHRGKVIDQVPRPLVLGDQGRHQRLALAPEVTAAGAAAEVYREVDLAVLLPL